MLVVTSFSCHMQAVDQCLPWESMDQNYSVLRARITSFLSVRSNCQNYLVEK